MSGPSEVAQLIELSLIGITRREPTRLELKERRTKIGTALQQRLLQSAVTEGDEIAGDALALGDQIDTALAAEAFIDDGAPVDAFLTSVNAIRQLIDQYGALSSEGAALPTPAAVADEAVKKRPGIRGQLEAGLKDRLAAQGEKQAKILAVVGPGASDMASRPTHDAARAALRSADFLDDAASDGAFRAAVLQVQSALAAVSALDAALDAAVLAAETKAAALVPLDDAIGKQAALSVAAPFAALVAEIGTSLAAQRPVLLAATDAPAAATVAGAAAGNAERRLELIAAAAALHPALATEIGAAVAAADAGPGGLLAKAWAAAESTAIAALTLGEAAAETLAAMRPQLQAVVDLTATAAALRLRADALAATKAEYWTKLSADQRISVGDVAALVGKLADIPDAATATILAAALTQSEAAATAAVAAWQAFEAKRLALVQQAEDLKQTARRDPATLFKAAVATADTARKQSHAKGLLQLDALAANAASYVAVVERMAELSAAAEELAVFGNAFNSTMGPIIKKVGEALDKPGTPIPGGLLGEIQTVKNEAVATFAYKQGMAPLQGSLSKAKTVKGVAVPIGTRVAQLEALAGKGKLAEVEAGLVTLAAELKAIQVYVNEGKSAVDAVNILQKEALPTALQAVISAMVAPVLQAVKLNDYTAAVAAAELLIPLPAAARPFARAHADATAALAGVTGLASTATKADDAKADLAFAARLAEQSAGLGADTGDLAARTKRMQDLAAEMVQAKLARRQAIKAQMGAGPLGTDRAAALFVNEATAAQAGRLFADLGADRLAALIDTVGAAGADPAARATAIATAVRGLGPIGGEQIEMLATQLGDIGHVGRLCAKDGNASLPAGLAAKFKDDPAKLGTLIQGGTGGNITLFAAMLNGSSARAVGLSAEFDADPAKLRSLLKDGLGDNAADIQSVFGKSKADGEQVKQLSTAFVDRAELQRLVTNTKGTGGARDPGTILQTLGDRHYSGDWSMLKTKLYDTLAAAPDGDRLMKQASDFKSQAASVPAIAQHSFGSVDIGHVQRRHNPDSFDFNDIKFDNTQFVEALRPQVPTICSQAVGEVRKLLDGKASSAVLLASTANLTGKTFKTYEVTVGVISLQVGYTVGPPDTVDQIFPLSGDKFSQTQMTALKNAFGK